MLLCTMVEHTVVAIIVIFVVLIPLMKMLSGKISAITEKRKIMLKSMIIRLQGTLYFFPMMMMSTLLVLEGSRVRIDMLYGVR